MPESGGEQRVLVRTDQGKRPRVAPADPHVGWAWIGWFGLLLSVAGVFDFALGWYPLRFGIPEWEFGTVVSTFSGLPLITMGFGALLGAGLARGTRWLLWVMAILMALFAVFLLVMLLLFLTNVPMALGAVDGVALLGIKKAVTKTVVLGVLFPVGYAAGAVAAVRHVQKAREG